MRACDIDVSQFIADFSSLYRLLKKIRILWKYLYDQEYMYMSVCVCPVSKKINYTDYIYIPYIYRYIFFFFGEIAILSQIK